MSADLLAEAACLHEQVREQAWEIERLEARVEAARKEAEDLRKELEAMREQRDAAHRALGMIRDRITEEIMG